MPFFIDRTGDLSILQEELYKDILEEELLNNELLNGGFFFDEERGVFEARRPNREVFNFDLEFEE